jgi:hypothetical protein
MAFSDSIYPVLLISPWTISSVLHSALAMREVVEQLSLVLSFLGQLRVLLCVVY